MEEKPLRLQVVWTEPLPGDWQGRPTEFGMQRGRSDLIAGTAGPDGTTTYDTVVVVYTDARDRLRFRGECVQGKPEEPFLYLSWRESGAKSWIMRVKVMLDTLDEAFVSSLPPDTLLQTRVSHLGGRLRDGLQEWGAV